MSNAIFPTMPGLAWSILKTPTWNTEVQTAYSGREIRRAMQARPKWKFTLTYEILRDYQGYAECKQMMAFFNLRKGSFDSFLLLDGSDSVATAQVLGTSDGTNKAYPILHSFQGYTEPVGYAVPTSVMANGVPTTAYTTDGMTITLNSAPAAGVVISWTGTFYYRVRFLNDEMEFEQFLKDFWLLKKCELMGVFDA